MPDVGLLWPGADLAAGSPAAMTDDVAVLRALITVEVAWVRAQTRRGITDAGALAAIEAAAADLTSDDATVVALATEVARDAVGGGNPVIPLLVRLRAAAGATAADAIHAGLTSQDVVDTALVLVLRDVAARAGADLLRAERAVAALARTHREAPALAHTLTQAAAPTTLGARFAGWLTATAAARTHLAAVATELPLSYGGAAGTLSGSPAGADSEALALVTAWADELALPVPPGPWHVVRTPVMRFAAALAETCAALGSVAADILIGARPEVGELREPSAPGRGASSSMPHKRNPVLSVLIRRSALAAPAMVAQVFTAAGLTVDERPDGAWHAEWPALQQVSRHAVAAAHLAADLLGGLEVDVDAAAANLRAHLGGTPADADTGAAAQVVDRVLSAWADAP